MAVSEIASATFEVRPVPNQRMMIGAKAIFGTLLKATTIGSTVRAMKGEYQSDHPSREPTTGPITKPRGASKTVTQGSYGRGPSLIDLPADLAMPTGAPNRQAGSLRKSTPRYQRPRSRPT